jgi:hypothetical protein
MLRFVVAVRMSKGGSEHSHIEGCVVVETPSFTTRALTQEKMVAAIDRGAEFITNDYNGDEAEVIVVQNRVTGARYIRTRKDNKLGDNLLFLPRYYVE